LGQREKSILPLLNNIYHVVLNADLVPCLSAPLAHFSDGTQFKEKLLLRMAVGEMLIFIT